jgi:hypothetical protein
MNSKLVSVLAAVCIVFILIIIGEWFYAVHEQKQTLASITSAETTTSDDEMPEIDLTQESEESYADMVTRPLFIKGRRPVDEPGPEEAQAANVLDTFDWQLNGVYSTKQGLAALFSRSKSKVAKDNHRKIRLGADLDGWKLTEINKDRVLLEQGSQQKELLLRKPKAKELTNKANILNQKNPSNMPNIPNSPQPPAGDFESNNE